MAQDRLTADIIRSDRHLDVFRERFLLPLEAEYAYGVATIDVAQQRLRLMLGADLVAGFPYLRPGSSCQTAVLPLLLPPAALRAMFRPPAIGG